MLQRRQNESVCRKRLNKLTGDNITKVARISRQASTCIPGVTGHTGGAIAAPIVDTVVRGSVTVHARPSRRAITSERVDTIDTGLVVTWVGGTFIDG